ncbi:MAG: hypothetical protein KHX03_02410 [Clostridium sp.]|nr:hypothetical protein [Clostridium sp.]
MHEYYFKIRKGDLEFECSTTDRFTFEEKLSDWINGITAIKDKYDKYGQHAEHVEPTVEQTVEAEAKNNEEAQPQKQERSGFIDVKNISSINSMRETQVQNIVENFEIINEEREIQMPEANFEQALEESIKNPKTEVIEKTEEPDSFSSYIRTYTPQSQTDFLIVTASYILNKEHQERFSIKQLNAKLIPYIGIEGKPVDHADIQEAINQGLIRVVPDLTGTSEVTEYTLTEQGEGYFVE